MDLYVKSANKTSSSNENHEHAVTPASISDSRNSSSGAAAAASSESSSKSSLSSAATPFGDNHLCYWSDVAKPVDMFLGYGQASTKFNAGKRKRRSSTKDPELGYEPPSAKRLQRLAAVSYGSDQSNQSSLGSSVYTSPLTASHGETVIAGQDRLSTRSSPAEELPEAPHSPLPDSPDSPPSPDRGDKQQALVVPYASETDQLKDDAEDEEDSCVEYSFDDEDEDDEENGEDVDDEEINSSSSSPASSTATGCSQNGEKTPATQQHLLHPSSRGVNKDALSKLNAFDDFAGHNSYNCTSPAVETTLRQCPLPSLSWGNAADVWRLMCLRDEQDSHLRSSSMLEQHPGLQPRMRAILLDWLIEVCEVYKLHRETFYLACDYLDRYLQAAKHVQKTHLQLIGITCLFVAAKVEEIYPPKICEFAYVTDGACTERDILQSEKLLLQALSWDICPITCIGWVGVYMQLNVNNTTPAAFSQMCKRPVGSDGADDAFIYPQFSAFEFVQTAQVLDLCTLDVGMANYPYSVLAAAAISHTFDRETALRCSGLDWQAIQACARWMEPFFHVISKRAPHLHLNEQNEQVTNKFGLSHICPNIVTDDSHIIQTHTTTMDMYDELLMAQNALHAMRARTQASPATALRAPESLLTPPASSHKPDEYLGDEEDVATITVKDSSSSSRQPQLASQKNTTNTASSGSSCS